MTSSVVVIGARWRPAAFIWLNGAAVLILLSWLWPQTRALWDQLDQTAFALLNGSLHQNSIWDGLWAITSLRPFDGVSGVLMLGLLLTRDWAFSAYQRRSAALSFISLLILLIAIRIAFNHLAEGLGWQHRSPSLQVSNAVLLSNDFPILDQWLELKDRSSRSFPGDHASILWLWGLFLACYVRGCKRWFVLGLCMLLMLPRLVAGAHWVSDDAVGGLFLALQALAWGYCTALGGYLSRALDKCLNPLFRWWEWLTCSSRSPKV